MARSSDEAYQKLNIKGLTILSDDEIAELSYKEPKLVQRPILESSTKAVIARPPQEMIAILE
ncbi:ArsC/Spx/MgsR family protein [Caedibacter taeniospiralis]|uniref:ArsC/Spx/MgsR family protein n=1 Tax=Caedibacter taeniospiralis TaxID=28907 RepID=UPI000C26E854|nr:ArsC/Spx/MgsR family protein [Caedibacter taeniospiralis]